VRGDLQLSSGLIQWAEGQVPRSCFCVFEPCRRVWSDQLPTHDSADAIFTLIGALGLNLGERSYSTSPASSVVPLRRRRLPPKDTTWAPLKKDWHVGASQEGLEPRARQITNSLKSLKVRGVSTQ
jgi:hypothetical protein